MSAAIVEPESGTNTTELSASTMLTPPVVGTAVSVSPCVACGFGAPTGVTVKLPSVWLVIVTEPMVVGCSLGSVFGSISGTSTREPSAWRR